MAHVFEVFWIFLRLGLTSFGGPDKAGSRTQQ